MLQESDTINEKPLYFALEQLEGDLQSKNPFILDSNFAIVKLQIHLWGG